MFTYNNIFDRFRSISVERINEFLTRKCIEHKYTELHRIEFKLEGWLWDLYVDDNYFNVNLAFPIATESDTDKHVNTRIAQEASAEVTKLLKVLKVNYFLHEYADKDNDNKIFKSNILQFSFESFCYNMYDFGKMFYDALNVIIGGYKEYHKFYDDFEAKLPGSTIGFRQYNSEDKNGISQITDRNHVGFI